MPTAKVRPVIIPDTREPKALLLSLSLEGEGAGVEVLDAMAHYKGDYLIQIPGWTRMIERKSISDLHSSIIDGRVFEQVKIMANSSDIDEAILLIEGNLWTDKVERGIQMKGRTGVHPNSIRGALLSIQRLGVRLVQSKDYDDTVRALIWLAKSSKPQELP
jgi:ERCC4-type nuclease